jgi:hypothetical protein
MSVIIESEDNVVTVSYLGWSFSFYFEDKYFAHLGIPTLMGKETYIVQDGRYYDQDKRIFAVPQISGHPEIPPSIDIGYMNKDGVYGNYYRVTVWKHAYTVFHSSAVK